jgi:6,7-dimethyl-8-ribityllumazine synthase
MTEAPHVLIVEARFYDHLADMLAAGAEAALRAAGATFDRIAVPGALEIPGAIALAERGRQGGMGASYDGYVALGCVIRGETGHYDIVAGESARGIMDLTLRGMAVGNGVLTVEDEAQAIRRADPAQLDKGGGAAQACIAMIALKRRFGA